MRIGGSSGEGAMRELGASHERMREAYGEIMARCTAARPTSVMIQDGTVKDETTFDPGKAREALASIASSLEGWDVQDVATTNNEDKRRLFTKFTVSEAGHTLSGHVSLQYHVLLYYAPDQKVLDCQLELSKLLDRTKGDEEDLARLGDEIVRKKLESAGARATGEQEIFEDLYNNEQLRAEIASEIDAKRDPDAAKLAARKAELYAELDARLLEVYKTSQVLIDEARLVGGEEGYVFTLDIERDGGVFDPSELTGGTLEAVNVRMRQLESALGRA